MEQSNRKYLILFHTHCGALSFEQKLKSLHIPCQLMPSPRTLSASCGICLAFESNVIIEHALEVWVDDNVDRLFLWDESTSFTLIYEDLH